MPLRENIAAALRECNAVNDFVDAFDAAMKDLGGCSNHGCMINPPMGMGTNGACKCLNDPHMARRFAVEVRRLRDGLRNYK